MTPYRSNALVVSNSSPKRIKLGVLIKHGTKPPKPHTCSPPGVFSRLWNSILPGSVWICKCGEGWKLIDNRYTDYLHNSWAKLSLEERNNLLKEAGFEQLNPWRE